MFDPGMQISVWVGFRLVWLSPFHPCILFPSIACGPGPNFMSILRAVELWLLPWYTLPFFLSCLELAVPNFAPEG